MTDKQERTAKLGPALALVGAIRDGDLKATRALLEIVSLDDATASCLELLRRMYLIAELHIADTDAAVVAAYCLDERNVWPNFYIRRIDRIRRTKARRFGMSFARAFLNHYVEYSGYVDDDDAPVHPPTITFGLDRVAKRRRNAWLLGMGYATTVIVENLTEYDDAELDDRLAAYRAAAARELLTSVE